MPIYLDSPRPLRPTSQAVHQTLRFGKASKDGDAPTDRFEATGVAVKLSARFPQLTGQIKQKPQFENFLTSLESGKVSSQLNLEQIQGLFEEGAKNAGLGQAFGTVFQKFMTPESQLIAAKLVRDYSEKGGNPQFLADFLTGRDDILKLSGSELAHHFGTIGETAAKNQSPEKRNAIRRLMERLQGSGFLAEKRQIGFIPAVELSTQFDGFLADQEADTKWHVTSAILKTSPSAEASLQLKEKLEKSLKTLNGEQSPAGKLILKNLTHPDAMLTGLAMIREHGKKGGDAKTIGNLITKNAPIRQLSPEEFNRHFADIGALTKGCTTSRCIGTRESDAQKLIDAGYPFDSKAPAFTEGFGVFADFLSKLPVEPAAEDKTKLFKLLLKQSSTLDGWKKETRQLNSLLSEVKQDKDLATFVLELYTQNGKIAEAQLAKNDSEKLKNAGLTSPQLIRTIVRQAITEPLGGPMQHLIATLSSNKSLQPALTKLTVKYTEPQLLAAVVTILQQSVDAGADPLVLADFFTSSPKGYYGKAPYTQSLYNFKTYFGGLPKLFQVHSTPEKRKALEQAMSYVWDNLDTDYPEQFSKLVESVSNVVSSFPSDIEDKRKWKLMPNLATRRDYSSDIQARADRIKALFTGLEKKPDVAEAVMKTYETSQSLEQANFTREMHLNKEKYASLSPAIMEQLTKRYGNQSKLSKALDIIVLYANNGGNPKQMADFFTAQPPGLTAPSEVNAEYYTHFNELTNRVKKQDTPEKRDWFGQAILKVYSQINNPAVYYRDLPMLVDAATNIMAALPKAFSADRKWAYTLRSMQKNYQHRDNTDYTQKAIDSSESLKKLFQGLEKHPDAPETLFKILEDTSDLKQAMVAKEKYTGTQPVSKGDVDPSTLIKLESRLGSTKYSQTTEMLKNYKTHGGSPQALADFLLQERTSDSRSPSSIESYYFSDFGKVAQAIQKYKKPEDRAVFDQALEKVWFKVTGTDRINLGNFSNWVTAMTDMVLTMPKALEDGKKWDLAIAIQKKKYHQRDYGDFSKELQALFSGVEENKPVVEQLVSTLKEDLDFENANLLKDGLLHPDKPGAYLVQPSTQALIRNKLGTSNRYTYFMQMIKAYTANGGDPKPIIDFFTTPTKKSDYTSPSEIGYDYFNYFTELGTAVKAYDTPEKKAAFAKALPLAYYDGGGVQLRSLVDWVKMGTNTFLSLPDTLTEQEKWAFVTKDMVQKTKLNNGYFYAHYDDSAKLKKVFEGIESDKAITALLLETMKSSADYEKAVFSRAALTQFKAEGIPSTQWGDKLKTITPQWDKFKDTFPKGDQLWHALPVLNQTGPGQADLVKILKWAKDHKRIDFDGYSTPQSLAENLKLLSLTHSPDQFLDSYILNQDKILPNTMYALFSYMENTEEGKALGKKILPEMMASLAPFVGSMENTKVDTQEYALQAVRTLAAVNQVKIKNIEPTEFDNYARIGTMGLSFPKWKYDAMKRWRGQGPMERPALFEESKLASLSPKRTDDKKYHGGFQIYNPETGTSIEMRRSYIVVSKPGLGTLVVRNSGLAFGRDLLNDTAYYHPSRNYTAMYDLFYPEEDLNESYQGETFYPIFSDKLEKSAKKSQMHQNISALLTEFDKGMEPYMEWKQGFQGGKASAGFKEMLEATLLSAKNKGAETPFGNKTHIRLAWVNPYGLPYPAKSFDVKDPINLAELEFYNQVLHQEQVVANPEEYRQQMPNLLDFINFGLEHKLELMLIE